jgi:hypothetical protein
VLEMLFDSVTYKQFDIILKGDKVVRRISPGKALKKLFLVFIVFPFYGSFINIVINFVNIIN